MCTYYNKLPPVYEGYIYRRIECFRTVEYEQSASRQKWKKRHLRWDPDGETFSMHLSDDPTEPAVWICAVNQLDGLRRSRETIYSDIQQSKTKSLDDPEDPSFIDKIKMFVKEVKAAIMFGRVESTVAVLKVIDRKQRGYDEIYFATENETDMEMWVSLFGRILNSKAYSRISTIASVSSLSSMPVSPKTPTVNNTIDGRDLQVYLDIKRSQSAGTLSIMTDGLSTYDYMNEPRPQSALVLKKPKRPNLSVETDITKANQHNLIPQPMITPIRSRLTYVDVARPLPQPATPIKASLLQCDTKDLPPLPENAVEILNSHEEKNELLSMARALKTMSRDFSEICADFSSYTLPPSGNVEMVEVMEETILEPRVEQVSRTPIQTKFTQKSKSFCIPEAKHATAHILKSQKDSFMELTELKEQAYIVMRIFSLQRDIEFCQEHLDAQQMDQAKEMLREIICDVEDLRHNVGDYIDRMINKTDIDGKSVGNKIQLKEMNKRIQNEVCKAIDVLRKPVVNQHELEALKLSIDQSRHLCRWMYTLNAE